MWSWRALPQLSAIHVCPCTPSNLITILFPKHSISIPLYLFLARCNTSPSLEGKSSIRTHKTLKIFLRGPSNSDTTRTATIKLPRHKKAVHISPIRLAHSPDSKFQLTVLPLALSRFAQSTFKEQHQNDFNTGKQRVSHGTQLQGPSRRIAIVCGPLAENSNRLRPFLQLCANESRSLASTESWSLASTESWSLASTESWLLASRDKWSPASREWKMIARISRQIITRISRQMISSSRQKIAPAQNDWKWINWSFQTRYTMISTRLSKCPHENNCEKTTSQTYCYQDGFPKQCDSIWNRRSSNTTRYESSFFKCDSIWIVALQMKQYNEESSPSFSSLISNWNRNVPQGSVTAQKTKGVHMTSNE